MKKELRRSLICCIILAVYIVAVAYCSKHIEYQRRFSGLWNRIWLYWYWIWPLLLGAMLAVFSFTGKAALKIDPVYLFMAAVILVVMLLTWKVRAFVVFEYSYAGIAVPRIAIGYCAVRAFFRPRAEKKTAPDPEEK